MSTTPKLTSAMMKGGGVYDSIIGQTSTPRADEKVLLFLDRMAPADPVDNVVVWTDDEEPADPRLHMFAPEHRRKGHKTTSLSTGKEQILDELAQSEMSYPHDVHAKKASGGPRRSGDPYRHESLEDFGSRGWAPDQKLAMSPPARPATVQPRGNSRAPSRMGRPSSAMGQRPTAVPSRPASVRPAYDHPANAGVMSPPGALEIEFKPATADAMSADGRGVRSLASTDDDLYPRVASPPARRPTTLAKMGFGQGPVAPLQSPFRSPQGLAASVALPHPPRSRAASAAAGSRPASRMATQIVRGEASAALDRPRPRPSTPPLTAAAFETPWFHRTQYGKQEPPTVVSTLRLKLVTPNPSSHSATPVDGYATPKVVTQDVDVQTPKRRLKTPISNEVSIAHALAARVVEEEPGDEHVLGHVHEVVEQEPDVIGSREELDEVEDIDDVHGDVADSNIGHHTQEHYDVIDNGTYRSVTPKAREIVLAAAPASEPDLPITEIVDVEAMDERQLVELLRTPAMRSEAADYNDEIQRALELHHDEDLCVLLQAAEDELQHPVVRRAVRKAIAGRLKKFGLIEDYEAVKKDPKMAAKLHKEAYGSPRSVMTNRLPDDAPEWAMRLSEHVRELTRQMQVAQISDKGQPRRITGNDDEQSTEYEQGSLHPGHAIDEGGMRYRPDTEGDPELLNTEQPTGGLVSPGERLYDEEIYKLRKRNVGGSPRSHATWEIEEEINQNQSGSVLAGDEDGGIPDIPDSDYYRQSPKKRSGHRRQDSNSQTGVVTNQAADEGLDWVARYSHDPNEPPPWLKVNQRLMNWAVIWPSSELENSLKSCERGEQVDDVALTIWTTQMYKRYVRAQMTQYPPQTVDKMFVPPNIADAINNAAYNGRHEEVAVMLRELWVPFGFKGHPKLILALTKHRREDNHWVVHRFSLADASIITYDTYLEKALPDGRPLGWWFGIRIAFANDDYPPPDHVVQRMIRLHRPLQLQVDNSVAASAIWRNLIMGAKADRLVDLERLRDLVRQEVKGIRNKKDQGKLSLGLSRSMSAQGTRAIEM